MEKIQLSTHFVFNPYTLLQSSTKLVYCLDSTFCELHISLSFAISGG